jgi:hexokinase
MVVIIDRFEGEIAVCEVQNEKRMIDLKIADLPVGAKVGDALVIDASGISIDVSETEGREKRIKDLMDSLWE